MLGAGGNAQPVAQAFAALHAGFDAGGRTVVAGGHDALVFHDHAADFAAGAEAAGPVGNDPGHFHKPGVPFIIHQRIPSLSIFRFLHY